MRACRYVFVTMAGAMLLSAGAAMAGPHIEGIGPTGVGLGPTGLSSPWSGMDAAAFRSNDPPGRVFPGKYFEYKAQVYLKKQDYREALDMFELAGFWANKIAQYNAGLMYYNGIGVPADRVRGVAWLGIAAEAHDDLAVSALEAAYASLSAEEKRQAGLAWTQLNEKYGDGVALPRAMRNYEVEMHMATGSHLGFAGKLQVYETGTADFSLGESGFAYYRRQGEQRDALIGQITGHVTVGAVEPIKISSNARANASQTPLVDPASKP